MTNPLYLILNKIGITTDIEVKNLNWLKRQVKEKKADVICTNRRFNFA
jgi:hypothetical protein